MQGGDRIQVNHTPNSRMKSATDGYLLRWAILSLMRLPRPPLSIVAQLLDPARNALPCRDAGSIALKSEGGDPLGYEGTRGRAVLLEHRLRAGP